LKSGPPGVERVLKPVAQIELGRRFRVCLRTLNGQVPLAPRHERLDVSGFPSRYITPNPIADGSAFVFQHSRAEPSF
jgi:hypothetical protein